MTRLGEAAREVVNEIYDVPIKFVELFSSTAYLAVMLPSNIL